MKKTESNNLEEKTPIIVKLKENVGNSSKSKNQSQGQEKIQALDDNGFPGIGLSKEEFDFLVPPETIEEAEIVNKSEVMDEIIKNNDKFETIRVLMEILCKELGISVESQFGEIHKALVGVTERYYKSMEDWKMLSMGLDINKKQSKK